jgi:uncharacterized lipoprotein YajG
MKSDQHSFFAAGFLVAALLLFAGCSTTTNKKPIAKPSHVAAEANDFPTALQAGIPAATVKK